MGVRRSGEGAVQARVRVRALARGLLGCAALLGAACSGAESNGRGGAAATNGGGDGFDNAPGAGGASGNFGKPTGAGGASGSGAGGFAGGSVRLGDECAADTYTAEQKRLDIYMIVDESGSMVPWWPGTLEAINMFFADPGSAGIGVGLQLFGSDCNPATYATPRVPIAPLPGNTAALQGAFPLIPVSGTATVPAMQGALMHAQAHAQANPDAKVVVLLVTDGLPDDCGSTVQGVVDAAAMGFAGSPSIQTFVVGLGIGLDALNMFAAAGGTGQALLVEPGAAQALVGALNQIRGAALPCDYKLPDGAQGDVAADTINMRYTTPDGAESIIGWVPDATKCDAQQGGWYYDNPSAPQRLLACEQSCRTLKDVGGQVQVVLGCPRVEIVPD